MVADERTDPDRRIVGEYYGAVLIADATTLTGVNAADGGTRWMTAHPAAGIVHAAMDAAVPAGAALIASADDPQHGQLINTDTGQVIDDNVRDAGYEPLTDTWITVGGATVRGMKDGQSLWKRSTPAGTRLSAAGGGVVYLKQGRQLKVLNSLTGKDSES